MDSSLCYRVTKKPLFRDCPGIAGLCRVDRPARGSLEKTVFLFRQLCHSFRRASLRRCNFTMLCPHCQYRGVADSMAARAISIAASRSRPRASSHAFTMASQAASSSSAAACRGQKYIVQPAPAPHSHSQGFVLFISNPPPIIHACVRDSSR